MSGLYPSLHERFNSEGVCSVCLLEMASIPRFSCDNEHVICQRCRAYFFNCPQCLQTLREKSAHNPVMPQPPNQQPWTSLYPPSAPNLEDFHEHERGHYPRNSQRALTSADLIECPYSRLGCTAKFVEDLRDMHVSRCRYKHHRDEEQLTQVTGTGYPAYEIACRYRTHGCNVNLAAERLRDHEEICIYKDREPTPSLDCNPAAASSSSSIGDVRCKYASVGCNVRPMPHWRLNQHEEICVYKDRETGARVEDDDRIRCGYQSVGCQARAPHSRTPSHEATCAFEDRHTSWGSTCEADGSCRYSSVGCNVRMPPERLRGHEDICIYKDRY